MKKNLFVLCLLLCTTTLVRTQFGGKGAGTDSDPYQITNADELFEVRNDLLASYKLMNDVDLEQWIEEDNPTQGWSPIGNTDTPFQGTFDGNNKVIKGLYIKRTTMDNVGLFGHVLQTTIKNLALLAPIVTGNDNVGALVGSAPLVTYNNSKGEHCNIENIVVFGGVVSGINCVGGIVGSLNVSIYVPGVTTAGIIGCYSSSVINAKGTKCGGICGSANGYVSTNNWGVTNYGYSCKVSIRDNSFMGKVQGKSYVGGILGELTRLGNLSYCECLQNIVVGGIIGEEHVSGIAGNFISDGSTLLKYNVSMADTISAFSSSPYRIVDNEWPNNFAYSGTKAFANGKSVTLEDNNYNGTAYGLKTLKKQSTYEGMEFDFSNQWTIVEGETFPYNKRQSAPPTVTSFTAGNKGSISGTATGNGGVYVMVGNDIYESYILDNKWSVTLGAISKGTMVKVMTRYAGLMPSIFVTAVATSGSGDTPEILKGDANGDGSVDTVDAVAIVNHILGKSSVSFVEANADLNGDGQVSVDDAVATVQLILDKQ